MTGILEKFQKVQIKNENRLSLEDQEFCLLQQKLYDETRTHYFATFDDMEKLSWKENSFWASLNQMKERADKDVYCHRFINLNLNTRKEIMFAVHQHFVKRIISYFNQKYELHIEEPSWKKYVHIKEPQEPPFPDNYFRLSPEERASYEEIYNVYKEQRLAYDQRLIHLRLFFEEILDDVFAYLNGFTFYEKVELEIKAASQLHLSFMHYTVQGNRLAVYGLTASCLDSYNEYSISLSGEIYLAVLRALTFYDSQKEKLQIYNGWNSKFTTLHSLRKKEKEGIYAEHDACGNKVLKFKFYKNGRWDVVFDTRAHALEFARDYLSHRKAA